MTRLLLLVLGSVLVFESSNEAQIFQNGPLFRSEYSNQCCPCNQYAHSPVSNPSNWDVPGTLQQTHGVVYSAPHHSIPVSNQWNTVADQAYPTGQIQPLATSWQTGTVNTEGNSEVILQPTLDTFQGYQSGATVSSSSVNESFGQIDPTASVPSELNYLSPAQPTSTYAPVQPTYSPAQPADAPVQPIYTGDANGVEKTNSILFPAATGQSSQTTAPMAMETITIAPIGKDAIAPAAPEDNSPKN